MTQRVLIVCYYFPPLGLAGVRRPLSLFKKLAAYGYQPDILTVKPVSYFVYEQELLEGLDQSRIFRSGSFDPQRLMYLLGKREITPGQAKTARKVSPRLFPDSKKGWIRPAVRLGRTLCENYRYKAIISTSPPVSSHVIAMQLAEEFKTPWLADFRDFWSMNKLEDEYDKPRMIQRGNELLKEIINKATEVTGVNSAIIDYLGAGHVIRNGYDPDRAKRWDKKSRPDAFVLGVPSNQVGRGQLQPLWDILKKVRDSDTGLFSRLELMQVGITDPEQFAREASQVSESLKVKCTGYLRGDEYIRQLSQASAFYIGLTDDMSRSIIPSRIFELLASGRPILAYCHSQGELSAIILEHSCGIAFDQHSLASAAESLAGLIKAHLHQSSEFHPLSEFVKEYSTDVMVERIAGLLDQMV